MKNFMQWFCCDRQKMHVDDTFQTYLDSETMNVVDTAVYLMRDRAIPYLNKFKFASKSTSVQIGLRKALIYRDKGYTREFKESLYYCVTALRNDSSVRIPPHEEACVNMLMGYIMQTLGSDHLASMYYRTACIKIHTSHIGFQESKYIMDKNAAPCPTPQCPLTIDMFMANTLDHGTAYEVLKNARLTLLKSHNIKRFHKYYALARALFTHYESMGSTIYQGNDDTHRINEFILIYTDECPISPRGDIMARVKELERTHGVYFNRQALKVYKTMYY